MNRILKIILHIVTLISISIFIHFIYHKDIKISNDALIGNNLYKFKVTKDYEQILAIKEENKYLYTLISVINDKDLEENEYILKRINLETSKTEKEVSFKTAIIQEPIITLNDKYIKIISGVNLNVHKFDKDFNLKNKLVKNKEEYNSYGEYNDKVLTTKDNNIYLDDKLCDSVLKSCGTAYNILYKDDTYLYFNNYNLNISCLYNVDNKKIDYLDNSNVEPFFDGYLSYNYGDNKITIKKDTEEKYYLNSKDETAFISITKDGNTLGTFNDNTREFKVYDLVNKKIINKIKVNFEDEYYVPIMSISNYMYIVGTNGENYDLYIWDYKKDNINENMISYSNAKNKIDSYELVTKIKDDFNVNMYIYDKGVRYFNDFYALPTYDDELTYDRLYKTYDILKNFNKEFFDKFKTNKNNGLEIYITGSLGPSDTKTQISNPIGYSLMMDDNYIIAIDANGEEYEKTICHELMHSIENNMYELYYNNKIKSEPFKKWNSFNPKNYKYDDSYVKEENDKYTIASNKDIYFIDAYSHTYANEDRARIFESFCSTEDIFSKYPNLKKKAFYLKDEITRVYPSIKDSKLFNILN